MASSSCLRRWRTPPRLWLSHLRARASIVGRSPTLRRSRRPAPGSLLLFGTLRVEFLEAPFSIEQPVGRQRSRSVTGEHPQWPFPQLAILPALWPARPHAGRMDPDVHRIDRVMSHHAVFWREQFRLRRFKFLFQREASSSFFSPKSCSITSSMKCSRELPWRKAPAASAMVFLVGSVQCGRPRVLPCADRRESRPRRATWLRISRWTTCRRRCGSMRRLLS